MTFVSPWAFDDGFRSISSVGALNACRTLVRSLHKRLSRGRVAWGCPERWPPSRSSSLEMNSRGKSDTVSSEKARTTLGLFPPSNAWETHGNLPPSKFIFPVHVYQRGCPSQESMDLVAS